MKSYEKRDVGETGGRCFAELGTVSAAMRAQQLLGEAAIPSAVIKQERGVNRGGCTYGISFSCAQRRNVATVLSSARMTVRELREL